MLCLASSYPLPKINHYKEEEAQSYEAPERFTLEGLVENPLNLSYSELWSFPLVSEVATLQCIGSGDPPYGPSVTYNWTGVPLFYLLSMAKVISGDYREVIFNATDGFSSSILLETAMHPSTILALEANGTDLKQVGGFAGGYRVVLPCRWGYKWVKWIKQIIVVDFDYKGTYEQWGYSDDAIQLNCAMSSTEPQITTLDVTMVEDYVVYALSNSTISSSCFANGRIAFNVDGLEGTHGYFYACVPKDLLMDPYQVYIDKGKIDHVQILDDVNAYFYFTYAHSDETIDIEIAGMLLKPLKRIVGQGYSVGINITVSNFGASTEDFNVTVYVNTTSLASTVIQVVNDTSTVITFLWNTINWNRGNYSLTAVVTRLSDETNYTLFGRVCVSIPGDLDMDFDVDLYDAVKLLVCYGAKRASVSYDPDCDIDGDGDIDLYDAVRLLTHYGQKDP